MTIKEELHAKGIAMQCPHCNRKLRKARFMEAATEFHRRTCPGCRSVWQIKTSPIGPVLNGKGFATQADWLELDWPGNITDTGR